MAKLILIKDFSNYENRFVRTEKLSDFHEEVEVLWAAFSDMNFDKGDGLMTSHVFNSWDYSWSPDYLLEYANDVLDPTDPSANLGSRWFVIEFKKIRGKQYKAILQRDIVADKYANIINAPVFIEKATLDDTDKMIYNSENMNFNQIKTEETLLKDDTGVGWIVGYLTRVQPGETDNDIAIAVDSNMPYDYTFSTFASAFGITITDPTQPITARILKWCGIKTYKKISSLKFLDTLNLNGDGSISAYVSDPATEMFVVNSIDPAIIGGSVVINRLKTAYETGLNNRKSTLINQMITDFSILDYTKNNDFLALNNQIIFDGSGSYYILKLAPAGSYNSSNLIAYNGALGAVCQSICGDAVSYYNLNTPDPTNHLTIQNAEFKFEIQANNYILRLEPYVLGSMETQISASRNKLEDAPYDMFCIPYGQIKIITDTTDPNNPAYFNTKQQTALLIAQAIGHQSGTRLLDLQLLPYFPITDKASSVINIVSLTNHEDYDIVEKVEIDDQNNETRTEESIIFYSKISSGNIAINYSKMPQEIKIENECDMYRLVSPNYQGQFEFNLAKCGGITYFNVDFTYKPYNPYIHINPDFSNLYGRQFGDARGLICGGDFSVAVATDQWAQYEINNKNYQNIFDRGIKNLEVMQRQERITGAFNAATGTLQGGGIGAAAGSSAGPYGAIAGAAIGTVAGGIGGVVDYNMLLERQREARSYQIDQFNMSLQNIKAMPDSLTKSSALTANNKIFPFLEYYTCTDIEKEALRNKLKYNGMTVGRIGTIAEFLKADYTFIQCKLIRMTDAGIDSNQWQAIARELAKGVYIK